MSFCTQKVSKRVVTTVCMHMSLCCGKYNAYVIVTACLPVNLAFLLA